LSLPDVAVLAALAGAVVLAGSVAPFVALPAFDFVADGFFAVVSVVMAFSFFAVAVAFAADFGAALLACLAPFDALFGAAAVGLFDVVLAEAFLPAPADVVRSALVLFALATLPPR
jgi:hypothetical protein